MDLTSALWLTRRSLIFGFHAAIVRSMNDTWTRCAPVGPPQEPDLVAGLVLDATPAIYGALSSALVSYGLTASVSGVFCHQSPKVSHKGPNGGICEIGDLLFAFAHQPNSGPIVRNALLLQAKSTDRNPYSVGSSEKVQLELYEKWPAFQYTSPANLRGQGRAVTPSTPHAGAQYLLLDSRSPKDPASGLNGLPGTFPAGCAMASPILHIHSDIAMAIFDLMTFKTGRPFGAKGASAGDWSAVVWDLIGVGLTRAFNRKRSGRAGAPRSAGGPMSFEDRGAIGLGGARGPSSMASEVLGPNMAHLLYETDGAGNIPRFANQDRGDDDGGISIVLIETREREG
jgi:hypothetical protein